MIVINLTFAIILIVILILTVSYMISQLQTYTELGPFAKIMILAVS